MAEKGSSQKECHVRSGGSFKVSRGSVFPLETNNLMSQMLTQFCHHRTTSYVTDSPILLRIGPRSGAHYDSRSDFLCCNMAAHGEQSAWSAAILCAPLQDAAALDSTVPAKPGKATVCTGRREEWGVERFLSWSSGNGSFCSISLCSEVLCPFLLFGPAPDLVQVQGTPWQGEANGGVIGNSSLFHSQASQLNPC